MFQHTELPDIRTYLSPEDVVPREPVEPLTLEAGQAVTLRETVLREDGAESIEFEAMFLGHCGD